MSRILAIDYGGKRCGMAWTDILQISNNPLDTIATEQFESKLVKMLELEEISDVVFGLPAHADGNLTAIGQKVVQLISQLRSRFPNISFHTIDEAFSSQRAVAHMLAMGTKKKRRRQKESVDQMSAVLILRDFLNRL